jgi:hypothetical protein
MPTRTVVSDDETGVTYEVRDDDGKLLHHGFTPTLPPDAQIRQSLAAKATAALAANNAYLSLGATATPAQRDTHIRVMVRELNALIRLTLNLLDTDDA